MKKVRKKICRKRKLGQLNLKICINGLRRESREFIILVIIHITPFAGS